MDQGSRLAKVARRDRQGFDCAPWVHKANTMPREEFKREVDRYLTGKDTGLGDPLFQGLQESNCLSLSRGSKRRP